MPLLENQIKDMIIEGIQYLWSLSVQAPAFGIQQLGHGGSVEANSGEEPLTIFFVLVH